MADDVCEFFVSVFLRLFFSVCFVRPLTRSTDHSRAPPLFALFPPSHQNTQNNLVPAPQGQLVPENFATPEQLRKLAAAIEAKVKASY